MFYDVDQAIAKTLKDPTLVMVALHEGYRDVLEKVLDKIDLNLCDEEGNNVLMLLLKAKYYDLVLKGIKRNDVLINHQNNDGDTFAHLVVMVNYVEIKDIINVLLERKDFIPNIKNNKGETILDKSINNHYIYTASKILGDKRFNNINLVSFKSLYEAYIKNNEYGKYSKLSNFNLIMNNLSNKKLLPNMQLLVNLITDREELIKNDFFMSKTNNLEDIINNMIEDTI